MGKGSGGIEEVGKGKQGVEDIAASNLRHHSFVIPSSFADLDLLVRC